jgi:hypothetical protein
MVIDADQQIIVLAEAVQGAIDKGSEKIKGANMVLKVSNVVAEFSPLKPSAKIAALIDAPKGRSIDERIEDRKKRKLEGSSRSLDDSASSSESGLYQSW